MKYVPKSPIPKGLPPKLEKSEWDFDAAIEYFGLDHTFIYEYSRSCALLYPEFKSLIEKAGYPRSKRKKKQKKEKIVVSNRDEISAKVRSHPFGISLESLGIVDGFPELPLIENDDYKYCYDMNLVSVPDHIVPFNSLPLNHIDLSAKQWARASGESIEITEDSPGGRQMVSSGTYIIRPEYPDPVAASQPGFVTYSLITINWAAPKEEIVEQFEKFVDGNQPPRYQNKQASKQKQSGIKDYPATYDKKNALQWLGVWRRWQPIKNWTQFEWVYEDDLFDPDKDPKTVKDTLRDQIKKAASVLNSIVNPGNIKTNRNGRHWEISPPGDFNLKV